MTKRFKYLFIGLCFLMIIATCFGCTNSKNSDIQGSAVNYLKEQDYTVQESAKSGFNTTFKPLFYKCIFDFISARANLRFSKPFCHYVTFPL